LSYPEGVRFFRWARRSERKDRARGGIAGRGALSPTTKKMPELC
jgi:hypothetical protein